MIWTRRGLWPSVAIVATHTLVVASAVAQQGAGVLTGKVVDGATKAPVADAVITVTSPALQGEQIVVTDDTGLYRVPNLPPGAYTMRIEKETFKPYAREEIALRADTTIRIDASLLPESVKAEEVVVVAQNPTVDVGSSAVGQTVNSDFTKRIVVAPVLGKGGAVRSFESVAEVTPGAKIDNFGVSINGTTSNENSYQIDGVTSNNGAVGTNGAPLSMEFIREVNVITGGYMPEYGKATGGTITAVTKQGSNEFHGEAFTNSTPDFLEARRHRIRLNGDAIEVNPSLNYVGDIGADVGGPIIKDKLWFFVGGMAAEQIWNLDRTINARALDSSGNPIPDGPYYQTNLVRSQRFHAGRTDYQGFGKLTYTVDSRNRINLSVFALPSSSGGNGRFSIEPQAGIPDLTAPRGQYSAGALNYVTNAINGTLKWTTESESKNILVDTTIGYSHQSEGTRGADGSRVGSGGLSSTPQTSWQRTTPGYHSLGDFENVDGTPCDRAGTASAKVCPLLNFTTGGPGQLNEKSIDRVSAKSVLTYLAEGLGHHVAKAGFEAEYLRYANTRGYSGGRVYQESTDGASFQDLRQYGYLQAPDKPVILNTLEWITHSLSAGAFVQDSWSILDKVTVNVGFRYDTQLLYGGDSSLTMALPGQWSPRIGVIWDPTQSGHAKLYGNFARYYESVPLNIMDRAGSSEPNVTSYHNAATCDPRVPSQANGSCLLDQNRIVKNTNESPDRRWVILGAGKEPVSADLKPQSSDELLAGAAYDIVKNGRLDIFYVKRWFNEVIEDVSRDEGQTYIIGNPGFGLLRDFPKPVRNYDGLTVSFTKAFADDWLAVMSYTVSYLRGNYPGLFRPETGQLDPNSGSDFDLRELLINRTGPLPGDNTHYIKLFGAKDWDVGDKFILNTGLSFRANSGAPTNTLGRNPLYGVDEVFILPRGSNDRLPWTFSIDPKVGFGWKWDKQQTVVLSIDVFNLFNFQGVTSRDQRYTATNVKALTTGGLPQDLKHVDNTRFDPLTERNPNFNNPSAYQPPRQVRIGVRTTF